MSQPMRVLYVLPSTKAGGVPAVTHTLLELLDRARVEPELVAPDDGPFFPRLSRLARVHDLPIRGMHGKTLAGLRRLLGSGRFQIVHALGRGAGLYARLAAAGLPVKVVYAYHGFHYQHYPRAKAAAYMALERLLLPLTDAVVCVSAGERRKAIEAGVLTEEKARLIFNGVDAFGYSTRAARPAREGPTIGTLARVSAQKGLEYLIPAAARLKTRFPGLRCLIAGGAQPEERGRLEDLRALARRHDLGEAVRFLGEIDDVAPFLAGLDVYVSAALWEGLPTAVLEAFAARVPVVATDVTGNAELVADGRTGLLAPARDERALAEGIGRLLADGRLGARLADAAFEVLRARYSPERMARAYEELYSELCGEKTR